MSSYLPEQASLPFPAQVPTDALTAWINMNVRIVDGAVAINQAIAQHSNQQLQNWLSLMVPLASSMRPLNGSIDMQWPAWDVAQKVAGFWREFQSALEARAGGTEATPRRQTAPLEHRPHKTYNLSDLSSAEDDCCGEECTSRACSRTPALLS